MKRLVEYWPYIVLFLAWFILNELLVEWRMTVILGGFSFRDGFMSVLVGASLFFTLFVAIIRLVPYMLLGACIYLATRMRHKDLIPPLLIGGLLGILPAIYLAYWQTLLPFYTSAPCSSTQGLGFLYASLVAVPFGAAAALVSVMLYMPMRHYAMWKVLLMYMTLLGAFIIIVVLINKTTARHHESSSLESGMHTVNGNNLIIEAK